MLNQSRGIKSLLLRYAVGLKCPQEWSSWAQEYMNRSAGHIFTLLKETDKMTVHLHMVYVLLCAISARFNMLRKRAERNSWAPYILRQMFKTVFKCRNVTS